MHVALTLKERSGKITFFGLTTTTAACCTVLMVTVELLVVAYLVSK